MDRNIYEPYLAETGIKGSTGIAVDPMYSRIMDKYDILNDSKLFLAGQKFLALHDAQYKAVTEPKNKSVISNRKSYRNKAFVESVLCGWSYVSGLLQGREERLNNHYRIPKTSSKIPDPLNADEMSKFKHDKDKETYRGLGTRSALPDRQRIAQLFLAKSLEENAFIDEKLMNKAVSQVIGLQSLSQGYA